MRVRRLNDDGTYAPFEKLNPNSESSSEKIKRLEEELQAANDDITMMNGAVAELMTMVLSK